LGRHADRRPECGRCRRDSRHAPRVRERGKDDRGFERNKWAQRKNFENTRDLVGVLLGAKNAGVTLFLPYILSCKLYFSNYAAFESDLSTVLV
jgi:hypothetical protein